MRRYGSASMSCNRVAIRADSGLAIRVGTRLAIGTRQYKMHISELMPQVSPAQCCVKSLVTEGRALSSSRFTRARGVACRTALVKKYVLLECRELGRRRHAF